MRALIGALALIALLAVVPAGTAAAEDPLCTDLDYATGACPRVSAGLTNDSAVLHGSVPGGGSGSTGTGGTGPVEIPVDPACIGIETRLCSRSTHGSTALPIPTLNDLAAFRPSPGVDHMEPDGWFVVGLDANFYATGGSSVVPGTLLGYPANVRFTPIRWRWTYGDGTSATRATRGATWAAQGIQEFEPTSTSHVYSAPGTYYIDLTIGYRAEYNFNNGGLAAIAGTLRLPANRLVATVGSAKTVLVERDCTLSPVGPGCSN